MITLTITITIIIELCLQVIIMIIVMVKTMMVIMMMMITMKIMMTCCVRIIKILFFDWCMGRKVSDQIDPQINIHSPLHIDHKTVHLNKGIK